MNFFCLIKKKVIPNIYFDRGSFFFFKVITLIRFDFTNHRERLKVLYDGVTAMALVIKPFL